MIMDKNKLDLIGCIDEIWFFVYLSFVFHLHYLKDKTLNNMIEEKKPINFGDKLKK
jgi:hypothetical protein